MYQNYGKLCTEVYDFTKPVGHSIDGDIEYYQSRLHGTKGKILEAGVGSGRFIVPLLESGLIVDGIDYSEHMLDACRVNCELFNQKPMLYQGNLQDFTIPYHYEVIVIPTGSFSLIDRRDESIAALENFFQHLASGGRLILDLSLPSDWTQDQVTFTTFEIEPSIGITLESRSVSIDYINQVTTTLLKYEKWDDGKLVDTELQKFSMHWYGVSELEVVLSTIGFKDISISSDYQYGEYPTNDSQIITFEATKP